MSSASADVNAGPQAWPVCGSNAWNRVPLPFPHAKPIMDLPVRIAVADSLCGSWLIGITITRFGYTSYQKDGRDEEHGCMASACTSSGGSQRLGAHFGKFVSDPSAGTISNSSLRAAPG